MQINSRRGALELPVNFLVVLIITIVVFGFSLYFIGKFSQQGTVLQTQLDSQTKQLLQGMLQDQQFALTPAVVRVGVGDSATIGVGLLNTGTTELNWKLNILEINNAPTEWFTFDDNSHLTQKNEQFTSAVLVKPRTNGQIGTAYVYKVCATTISPPITCIDGYSASFTVIIK